MVPKDLITWYRKTDITIRVRILGPDGTLFPIEVSKWNFDRDKEPERDGFSHKKVEHLT